MREIALSQGYVALVDDADYEWLSRHRWYALVRRHTSYAVRTSAGGHGSTIYMHRAIVGATVGMETDHINGDGLDNRRENIRQCTRKQNNRNRRSWLGVSSGFKGVSWSKQYQKWDAQITIDGRKRHLGRFSVETEAGKAYKVAAEIAYGAFAAGARGDLERRTAG